ncbi:MAG: lipocalin family protein, partial [Burkholderiales bacterium]
STCINTTAAYTLRNEGSLNLRNVCVRTSPDGLAFEDTAAGVANVVRGSKGRKLKIAFGSAAARFFQRLVSFGGFDYWIYALGNAKSSAPTRGPSSAARTAIAFSSCRARNIQPPRQKRRCFPPRGMRAC